MHLIRYIRELRAELEPLAAPSTGRKTYTITSRQRVAIFDMLRAFGDLFPDQPPYQDRVSGTS